MSNEDPYRPNQGRDRGAYTPPTDDDLPFDRQGYDPRRRGGGGNGGGGGGKSPPVTLIVSALVLLALIIGVVVLYNMGGLQPSEDAPPAVGAPVGEMKTQAPIDAQPVDPAAGIDVYDTVPPTSTAPTFTPPPEEAQPRPEPRPIEAAPPAVRPAPTPAAPAAKPAPVPAPRPTPSTPAVAAGGSASVQIGAFSTPGLAEREYNAVVSRHSRFTQGASRRVQEVQSANGSTLYRTTVGGLSREQATGLCNAIKAGGGDCIVR